MLDDDTGNHNANLNHGYVKFSEQRDPFFVGQKVLRGRNSVYETERKLFSFTPCFMKAQLVERDVTFLPRSPEQNLQAVAVIITSQQTP